MPQWFLNLVLGFLLSFLAVAAIAFLMGERTRAQQGLVSDQRTSRFLRRIATALLIVFLATSLVMSAFVSPWFLLVPVPPLLLMLPRIFPIRKKNAAAHAPQATAPMGSVMFDMAIVGAWILETRGFEYATWFQSMLSDPTINPALREHALGIEERVLTRVYNWSRAILVGAYLLKLGEKDFNAWQTRLLATLDQTTKEEIVPFITELRQAAIELQADVGERKSPSQVLSILGNEQTTEALIGRVVGNYRIIEMIGEGGMGIVFRAKELMVEREVAVKVLRRDFVRQGEVVERFVSEANALAKLNHPNIATLYNFFREADDLFMVMELVRGETLAGVVSRHGPIPYQSAVMQFSQILEGIGYAHNHGVVHRDIKPSNVIVTDSGSVKVMDFGIARVAGTERRTKTGNIIGTLEYMSPEQIKGHEADSRSDIYSLGILLFEILTGRLPFSGSEYELIKHQVESQAPSPRVFVADIPRHAERAILRALVKNPEGRFQSVREFREALLTNTQQASRRPANPNPVDVQPSVTKVEMMAALRKQIELGRQKAASPADIKDTREEPSHPNRITSNEWISTPANDSLQRILSDACKYMGDTPLVAGSGKTRSELMVIDQSPNLESMQEGKPFWGHLGRLVTNMLAEIGLSREDCYLTYLIKHQQEPRGDWLNQGYYQGYYPSEDEEWPDWITTKYSDEYAQVLAWRGEEVDERGAPDEKEFRIFLLREILVVNPRVVLSFGGLATRTLLRSEDWLPELRGTVHTLSLNGREFSVIPTFRPQLLYHIPERGEELLNDLNLVRDCLALRRFGEA